MRARFEREARTVATLDHPHIRAIRNGNYDITSDGQRFLVNVSTGEGTSAPLTVILNWPALLRR